MNADMILRILVPLMASQARTSGDSGSLGVLEMLMSLISQKDNQSLPDPTDLEVKKVEDEARSIYDRIRSA